jgi:renalase
MMSSSVAIVGAGAAGMACARMLVDAGVTARLFDKGRAPGGRIATRRAETAHGQARFDHGAQYVTAKTGAFADTLAALVRADYAAHWTGDIDNQHPATRWTGTPGMSQLARGLAAGLSIETGATVRGAVHSQQGWQLKIERTTGTEFSDVFDTLIVALPAEQAAVFLRPIAPDFAEEAEAARTAPCWAGMFAFDQAIGTPFGAARRDEHGAISWIVRELTKPGRSGPEALTVHAAADWSRAHLEISPDTAAQLLWAEVKTLCPALPPPVFTQAHRWRYALVERTAATPFAWDNARRLGVCGDWRMGARVEDAWTSGCLLAKASRA